MKFSTDEQGSHHGCPRCYSGIRAHTGSAGFGRRLRATACEPPTSSSAHRARRATLCNEPARGTGTPPPPGSRWPRAGSALLPPLPVPSPPTIEATEAGDKLLQASDDSRVCHRDPTGPGASSQSSRSDTFLDPAGHVGPARYSWPTTVDMGQLLSRIL
jgi:hypothetical protein